MYLIISREKGSNNLRILVLWDKITNYYEEQNTFSLKIFPFSKVIHHVRILILKMHDLVIK